MNDPVTLALVFAGGAGGSAIRWLVGIGVGERYTTKEHSRWVLSHQREWRLSYGVSIYVIQCRLERSLTEQPDGISADRCARWLHYLQQLSTRHGHSVQQEDARVGRILLDWLGGCCPLCNPSDLISR